MCEDSMWIAIGILVIVAMALSWLGIDMLRTTIFRNPFLPDADYFSNELFPRYGGDKIDPPAYSHRHRGKLFEGRGPRPENLKD